MPYAVITGISSGIGLDATRMLIENGFHVFGTVRKVSDKQALLKQFPEHLDIIMMDVTEDEAIDSGMKYVQEQIGDSSINVLINNAGVAVPGPLMYMTDEEFFHQINVNVLAVRKLTNAFLPMLGFQEDFPHPPGKIINISSVSGLFNNPFNGAYSISKHALESMNDVYRRELLKFGIDVIAIEPGPIKTKIWNKNIGGLDKYKDSLYGDLLKNADRMIKQAEAGALPVKHISNLILKILKSNKPKTRYMVHRKPLLFKIFSKWLPDRMQDRLVWKTLNKKDGKYRPV